MVTPNSSTLCKLGKYCIAYVLDDDVFFSSHSWYALHPFTKFTDQQSRACNINSYAAIQVVYINTFCEMFCGMLNFDTYG